jgi:NTE family protein
MRTLKLGLALGGGGTKGAAHVGVMRVLDEAGIKIDAIAGTSIGSLYGGLYAVGRSAQEMEDGIRANPNREVIDFFRHRLKIRHPNALARRFYEALAGFHIEDLNTPYAATASDMSETRSVTIVSGPIIDAIEASIAIPLLARPVSHQGRYLLDGGFYHAAPVDAVAELGADVIIAIELGHPYQLPANLRAPAAWIAARLDAIPLRRTIAGVPFTIRAVTHDLQAGRTAHVVLRPRAPGVNGSSPFGMTRSLDAGVAAAQEALPAIRALLAGESPAAVAEEVAGTAPRLATDSGFA